MVQRGTCGHPRGLGAFLCIGAVALMCVSCTDESPVEAPTNASDETVSNLSIGAGLSSMSGVEACSVTGAFHLFPPLGADQGTVAAFDPVLADEVTVSICRLDADGDCEETVIFRGNDVKLQDHRYHAYWKVAKADIGRQFRISFSLAVQGSAGPGLDLGSVTYSPKSAQMLPISLRIDRHPLIRAWVMLEEDGGSPTEIAEMLLAEFEPDAMGIATTLYCLGRGPMETAEALKAVGFASTDIALPLHTLFTLDIPDVAGVLRRVGFPVRDVAYAMLNAFQLEAEANARALVSAGFSMGEAADGLEAVYPLTRNEVHLVMAPLLIETFAPTLRLHPSEPYMPSSVDWYLQSGAELVDENGGRQAVTLADLNAVAKARGCGAGALLCWIEPDGSKKYGNLGTAKAYVHVYHPKDPGAGGGVDLQFWLFYPWNGPGYMYFRVGELADNYIDLDPAGEHPSDWESIILRFNQNLEPERAMLSAHGQYPDYPYGALSAGEVLASWNGHALFAQVGNHPIRQAHESFGFGTFDVDLLNRTGLGPALPLSSAYEVVALDGAPLAGKEWVAYPGAWGQPMKLNYSYDYLLEKVYDEHLLPLLVVANVACAALWWNPLLMAACYWAVDVGLPGVLLIGGTRLVEALVGNDYLYANGQPSPGSRGQNEWVYPLKPPCTVQASDAYPKKTAHGCQP